MRNGGDPCITRERSKAGRGARQPVVTHTATATGGRGEHHPSMQKPLTFGLVWV
jgi:hypothetical protein